MNKVYHGSPRAGLAVLEPRPSNLLWDCPVVFATPIWIIALIMGLQAQDDTIQVGVTNHKLTLQEMQPNAFQEFLHRPTTVYTFDYDEGDFRFYYDALWTLEMVSPLPQRPVREQLIEDPYPIIKKSGVELIGYKEE
jgi:hypothetical protein